MNFDTSTFPIVWLRASCNEQDDEGRDFVKLERLLERQQPMVLVTDHAFCTYHSEDAIATRRKINWLRRHRSSLQNQIKALIQVEPDAQKRKSAHDFGKVFLDFWGYPLLVVEDETDAIGLALELFTGADRKEEKRCLH
ncbi:MULTISPECIES: hypothetical protein [Agrobacterium]|uniref:hypothetical protein n=1 Tax=Agrobacterium tumefaciens TaxID=358 RepID=UPI000EF2F20B|nr:hypothetical protein At1D1108_50760 [Agrobacterium tumefaciens]NSY09819.1 hypothetical protein [Agrobacterium tumefaciens]NSY93324.1 hypothetical protein [Agrobacterium tumefaciens]